MHVHTFTDASGVQRATDDWSLCENAGQGWCVQPANPSEATSSIASFIPEQVTAIELLLTSNMWDQELREAETYLTSRDIPETAPARLCDPNRPCAECATHNPGHYLDLDDAGPCKCVHCTVHNPCAGHLPGTGDARCEGCAVCDAGLPHDRDECYRRRLDSRAPSASLVPSAPCCEVHADQVMIPSGQTMVCGVCIALDAQINAESTARRLESAYRALDYSTVRGNSPASDDDFALVRADLVPRGNRSAEAVDAHLARFPQPAHRDDTRTSAHDTAWVA